MVSKGTAYFEYELARDERRIKKISENTDPTKPKSNILLYECDKDLRIEQINAVKEGKPPFCQIYNGPMARGMGFIASRQNHWIIISTLRNTNRRYVAVGICNQNLCLYPR